MIKLKQRTQSTTQPNLRAPGQDEEARALGILFQGYLDDEREAAESFASLIYPILIAYFRSGSRYTTEAEDLAQECWSRIHLSRPRFRQGMPVLPWIFGVARHTRLDSYRRNKLRFSRECEMVEYRDFEDRSLANMDELLEAKGLLRYLRSLPASQRTVLLLQYEMGLSQGEVAQQLGCSSAAVKQKVFRARTTLRHLLHSRASIREQDQNQ